MLFYLTFTDLRSQDFVLHQRRTHVFLEEEKIIYKLRELMHPDAAEYYTQIIYEMTIGKEIEKFNIFVRRVA